MAIPLDVMLRYDHGLTVADFDGDGRLDLALFGYTGEGTNAAYLWLRKDRP